MTHQRTTARLQILQTYRAAAAFVVVLHHINGKFSATHYYGPAVPNFFGWGQLGVDFFFVLSGFIIAMSLSKTKAAPEFLAHRAVRIFPPFWLAFFATLPIAVLAVKSLHTPIASDPMAFVRAVLLLPQDPAPVITVAWTLQHEVLFYALSGLWIIFPRSACAIAAVLLTGSFFKHDAFLAQFLFSPFHWEFLAGIAAFAFRDLIPGHWVKPLVWASAVLLAAACTCFGAGVPVVIAGRFLTFGALFAVLVAASSRLEQTSESRRSLTSRVGPCLGDSSYTLYLWHVSLVTPLTKAVFARLPHISVGLVFLFSIAIACVAVVLSHLIYVRIEGPFVGALRSLVDKTMRRYLLSQSST